MIAKIQENLDEDGAKALANRIDKYWRDKGRPCKVWVEKFVYRQSGH